MLVIIKMEEIRDSLVPLLESMKKVILNCNNREELDEWAKPFIKAIMEVCLL
jgi:hypothetical protein